MNKKMIRNIGAIALSMTLLSTCAYASTDDYGAQGAKTREEYSLEEMLEYAIQDEYLAKAEYEAIIDEFDVDRPFTNIINAEQQHIEAVEALYEDYDMVLPEVDPDDYIAIPETLEEAFEIGVVAEIENIAMYESFLETDLPDDVRAVFEALKKGSESHLQAFTRNSSDDKGSTGANGNNAYNGNNQNIGNGNSNSNQGSGNQGNRGQGNNSNSNNQNNRSKNSGGSRQNQNLSEECILDQD